MILFFYFHQTNGRFLPWVASSGWLLRCGLALALQPEMKTNETQQQSENLLVKYFLFSDCRMIWCSVQQQTVVAGYRTQPSLRYLCSLLLRLPSSGISIIRCNTPHESCQQRFAKFSQGPDKVPTRVFTFENLLKHYVKCVFKHGNEIVTPTKNYNWKAVWFENIL